MLESLEYNANSNLLKVTLDKVKVVVDFTYNNTRALYKVAAVLCNFKLNLITKSTLLAIL